MGRGSRGKRRLSAGAEISRRALFAGLAGAALMPLRAPGRGARAATLLQAGAERRLRAAAGSAPLVGGSYPDTAVWCYEGVVPGPLLRARQGEAVRLVVENHLQVGTSVHWHGLRVPNAMDGVPGLTQDPIASGARFVYEFELPDAGTYWYHPHIGSPEQVGRGLYGAFIVEETEPPLVDRELVWIIDDWRLTEDAQISDDFGNWHDASHAGRLGNTVTVNGRQPQDLSVRAGERIRLRLINAANARVFALRFQDHRPRVIALDGQPVAPHEPAEGLVVLAPAQRVDLILDLEGQPGQRSPVDDVYYQQDVVRFLDLVYDEGAPLRDDPLDGPIALAANPLAEPELATAERHRIEFGGGMMDPKLRRGEVTPDALRERFAEGGIWTVNGVAHLAHAHEPLLRLTKDRSAVLDLVNDTVWDHPIHLHGHSFRVLTRNGQARPHREWRDTLLLRPGDRAEIAFVADNPGDWMFHCHILEHQETGMMATLRVG